MNENDLLELCKDATSIGFRRGYEQAVKAVVVMADTDANTPEQRRILRAAVAALTQSADVVHDANMARVKLRYTHAVNGAATH